MMHFISLPGREYTRRSEVKPMASGDKPYFGRNYIRANQSYAVDAASLRPSCSGNCASCTAACAGATGPTGPRGPAGPMGPAASILTLKGVLPKNTNPDSLTGQTGDAYIIGSDLYAYDAVSGKFVNIGPVNTTSQLAADPTGIAAWGEICFSGQAHYSGMVTYPIQVRMDCFTPPYNVLYEPANAITVIDAGTYEVTRQVTYRANERNSVSFAILISGAQVPRSVFYTEGTSLIVERYNSYLLDLNAGDEVELWVVSLRNTLDLTLYYASLTLKRIG